MRRRIAAFLSTALAATTLAVFAQADPASATTVCAGTGTATVNPGLLYPVAVNVTGTEVFVLVGSNTQSTFTFSFAGGAGACVDPVSTTTDKTLTATGTVAGFCGLSTGSGITGNGHLFGWVDVGGFAIVTGHLVGVVQMTPDIASGQTCAHSLFTPLPAGATRFLWQGAVLLLHCTVLTDTNGLIPIVLTQTLVATFHFSVHLSVHFWINPCIPGLL